MSSLIVFARSAKNGADRADVRKRKSGFLLRAKIKVSFSVGRHDKALGISKYVFKNQLVSMEPFVSNSWLWAQNNLASPLVEGSVDLRKKD